MSFNWVDTPNSAILIPHLEGSMRYLSSVVSQDVT
jgi:hypothetical protein